MAFEIFVGSAVSMASARARYASPFSFSPSRTAAVVASFPATDIASANRRTADEVALSDRSSVRCQRWATDVILTTSLSIRSHAALSWEVDADCGESLREGEGVPVVALSVCDAGELHPARHRAAASDATARFPNRLVIVFSPWARFGQASSIGLAEILISGSGKPTR
jgi:hypothetical protein